MSFDMWRYLTERHGARVLAYRGNVPIRVKDVQYEAARLQARLGEGDGPIYLHCVDAANVLAGMLAGLSAGREVRLPGHAAPNYLAEICAVGPGALGPFLTDAGDADPHALKVDVSPGATSPEAWLSPGTDARIAFFTSGSTGVPKLCGKAIAAIASELEIQCALWPEPAGVVLGTVSHQHIYGLLFRVLWPLAIGRPFVTQALPTWEAVDRLAEPGSAVVASPAHLSRIPDAFFLTHTPHVLFSSGGPLPSQAAHDAARKCGHYPIEILGSTETGGVAWRAQDREPALWTPLPQVEIQRDDDGALAVRSPFTGSETFLSMGDGVDISADGKFTLRGRLDRVVKVEGVRVSLARVEQALRELGGVKDAAVVDLPERGGILGAVVALSSEGESSHGREGSFRYSRYLRNAMAGTLEPMERPKAWRFVSEVPENSQGKRIATTLRALFAEGAPGAPRLRSKHVTAGEARFEMEFTEEFLWFDGHFPGQPILPGVVQLEIASQFAKEFWGLELTGRNMARVKFRQVVAPGDILTLTLTRGDSPDIAFRYMRDDQMVSSGTFKGHNA